MTTITAFGLGMFITAAVLGFGFRGDEPSGWIVVAAIFMVIGYVLGVTGANR